jgi:hypothetical protein
MRERMIPTSAMLPTEKALNCTELLFSAQQQQQQQQQRQQLATALPLSNASSPSPPPRRHHFKTCAVAF